MFGWVPRWHPVVWLIVIGVGWAAYHDPAGWGHRFGEIGPFLSNIASRLGTFFSSL